MASSFSSAAKAEVCRILPQKHCCALAECFGVLLFANNFSADGIKIITESRDFAYILPKLFKKPLICPSTATPALRRRGSWCSRYGTAIKSRRSWKLSALTRRTRWRFM